MPPPSNRLYRWLRARTRTQVYIGTILFILYAACLPPTLFRAPTCTVLESAEGQLLGAKIAADGQWRFPPMHTVPTKFAIALQQYEDRRFYYHLGVDPLALVRATLQNLRNRRVVSGGSTLTMQVIRLVRLGSKRTVYNKIVEAIMATRLELLYSKQQILALYSSYAPMGGNIVGVEAAAWRYFAKNPNELSWSEAALLAVLPNSPSIIHPSKNRHLLLVKRNKLLERLHQAGYLDDTDYQLALEEPLPAKPQPIPQVAPHLLNKLAASTSSTNIQATRVRTTVQAALQTQLNEVLLRHHQLLRNNGINNLAAVILDVERGDVLAYTGNIYERGRDSSLHGEQVDVVTAPRSTGSVLKPFLYALMLHEGQITPNSLIKDIPLQINGFRPQNYKYSYDGVVPAHKVIARSLNIPSVVMLQQYGIDKFLRALRRLGFTTVNKSADYYGLSLILGGAEATLLDVSNAYAGMARTVNHYNSSQGYYYRSDFRKPNFLYETKSTHPAPKYKTPTLLSAGACWLALQAMLEVERPLGSGNWELYQNARQVSWKTGTSIGFRDAWSVGVTPSYVVGVWVGNADGEGRPDLVGVTAAAPVMFDIFDILPTEHTSFVQPLDDMRKTTVCSETGYRAVGACVRTDTIWTCKQQEGIAPCPYHETVHLDSTAQWRVNADCYSPSRMIHRSWLVLPPVEAYYYQRHHPQFVSVPPMREGCTDSDTKKGSVIQMIAPLPNARVYLPMGSSGERERLVCKVACTVPDAVLYWHLDNVYLGSTTTFHEMGILPSVGVHQLTVVDRQGYSTQTTFEVLDK
jgi:penicillin-binding protein 1C